MTVQVVRNAASPKTQVVHGGLSGPTGRPGASGTETVGRTAGAVITGLRAVSSSSGTQVVHTAQNDRESMNALLGIATQSAANATSVTIQTSGVLTDVAFAWTPDELIYVGTGGELTQTLPLGGFLRKVGVALSATSMAISFGPVIRR